MKYQKGKVFVAPTKLLRADKALYFPNLWGFTLATPKDERDTTPVLHGKLSVVAVFSGTWAEQQTKTFLDRNEQLTKMLGAGNGFLQKVDVNVELNSMKARLVKFFMGGVRKRLPEEQHGRYFLVTQGVTDAMRESLGMFNSQVGYVFLLDSECRIRWAGSAEASEEERESMIRGIAKLSKELATVVVEQKQSDAGVDTEALHVSPERIRVGAEKIAAIAGV
jgi:ATPase complex subunit ATP10